MGDRVEELLGELTLDEKVSLLGGEDWWHIPAVPRLGIGSVKVSDGPAGVRGAEHSGGPHSASFPCGTALAATWDVELIERVGAALAAELDSKGAHVILAPTVNLHRSPLAGRSFECFSEDPFLSARLAVAYINGVQRSGKGATVKHLVANDSEHERMTISSEVPERALRELYLLPFEAAVREAGVWCVMTAYNRVAGTYCSENTELITDILRDEWGFDGLVMSDWYGTHSTAPATLAGLDLEMPGPPENRGPALRAAVDSGEVPTSVLDDRVRAVLQLAARAGVLEAGAAERPTERYDHDLGRIALLREAAASGIVLLQNDPVDGRPVLPLVGTALDRVAVIGPTAALPSIEGGGSAHVSAPYAVSPVEGLAAALPGVEVVHEPGASIRRGATTIDTTWAATEGGRPGLSVRYFAGDEPAGSPVRDEVVTSSLFRWFPGLDPAGPGAPWSVEVTADFTAAFDGLHTFSVRSADRVRLWVGDEVADAWSPEPGERGTVSVAVELRAGESVPLRLHTARVDQGPDVWGQVDMRVLEPVPGDLADRAVAAASAADVAVVVVGLDSSWETEGRDRTDLSLPGGQVDLVRRVVAANPRTVVVVNAGAPVEMGWVDDVPAVLQAWYLGQETGNALADVLLGVVDAGGRLPTTIPHHLADIPAQAHYPGADGQVHYGEGLLVGYRGFDELGIDARYPFGHGLSYTAFEHGAVSLSTPTVGPGGTVEVSLPVTNVGDRAGDQVVQVYVSDVEASVPRPPKELKGFVRLHLEPAETGVASVTLDERSFAFWDPEAHGWTAEPGEFEVLVGTSATEIVGRASLRWEAPAS